MKIVKTIIVIITLVLLSGFGLAGCSDDITEPAPSRQAIIDTMKMVPADIDIFTFWDVAMLRENPELAPMYDVWYERNLEHLSDKYSIDVSDITGLAKGELLDIFISGYDRDALKTAISADYHHDSSVEGLETWKSEPSPNPQVPSGGWILADDFFVRAANNSNVDEFVRVAEGDDICYYDDDALRLLENMPDGVVHVFYREINLPGLLISGYAVEKAPESGFIWTHVYLFEDEKALEDEEVTAFLHVIEENFQESKLLLEQREDDLLFIEDFSMEYRGDFVTWSVRLSETHIISLLFYG